MLTIHKPDCEYELLDMIFGQSLGLRIILGEKLFRVPREIVYSSRDDHGIPDQPSLVTLKWKFSLLFMTIVLFHIFGVKVRLFLLQKIVRLGDVVSWRLGYEVKRFLNFGDREVY
jgi:hypothetical protein